MKGRRYPRIDDFSCFFEERAKVPTRWHFGEDFSGFLRIFEDFGLSIGLPFPHFFSKNEDSERKPKKYDFSRWGGG